MVSIRLAAKDHSRQRSYRSNSHYKYIKSRKSTKEKITKWLINHIHPRKRLPLLKWLPQYKLNYLKGDIIAGISVGLLLVPQSLAIAGIFGCPPIVGLYSSMAGPLSSFFFSTSPDNSVGPTVLVAILGSRFNPYGIIEYLNMMSFFSGIVMIILSFFNAGVLMNLVSFTVLSAFITCGSISIAVSQLPNLCGIKIDNASQMNSYELVYTFFSIIDQTNYQDLIIGMLCICMCLFCHYTMKYVNKNLSQCESTMKKIIWEIIWMLYVAKNALITIISTAVIYFIYKYYPYGTKITLTGKLEAGFPKPWFPVRSANFTYNGKKITLSAFDIISDIYPSFFLAPVMMFVETLALVKNFSKQKDYKADSTQELLNVGVANIINSFFRGYPIGGALSRSSLNSLSGVRTCLSGIITIVIVILSLMVMTPLFYYTPKSVLAGMIAAAVIPSIDLCQITLYWRVQKWELIPWFGTILIGLYRLELGMAIGLALSSSFILFREMRPRLHRIHHLHTGRGTFSVRLRSALHYPGATFITNSIKSFLKRFPELTELVIDCHAMHEIDITVARELLEIVDKLKKEKNIHIKFSYVKPGTVKHIMTAVGLGPYICEYTSVAAQDCRHCHSYHNHTAINSNTTINNDVKTNMETTRSAPIHLTKNLSSIKEVSEVAIEHESGETNTDANHNKTNDINTCLANGDCNNIDSIHTSSTGSESSSSDTQDSNSSCDDFKNDDIP